LTIRDQKFIYHLTSVDNVPSILCRGLLPRAVLGAGFTDIADAQIVEGRRAGALECFVPFHWFAKNPFDGRVHRDRPGAHFILIAVARTHAKAHNWKVIAKHPLAGGVGELLDYDTGFNQIDWDTMGRREYLDSVCRHVCMAECLAPGAVPVASFAKIFTPTEGIRQLVLNEAKAKGLTNLWVDSNPNMFPTR